MDDRNRVFDGLVAAPFIDSGSWRANRGNTNYAVPGEADTARIGSVVLWCSRFSVSFGVAQLHRA